MQQKQHRSGRLLLNPPRFLGCLRINIPYWFPKYELITSLILTREYRKFAIVLKLGNHAAKQTFYI